MLITLPTLQPAPPTEVDLIRAEIKRQSSWLPVAAVRASAHWTNDIIAKINNLNEQLARIGGAR